MSLFDRWDRFLSRRDTIAVMLLVTLVVCIIHFREDKLADDENQANPDDGGNYPY